MYNMWAGIPDRVLRFLNSIMLLARLKPLCVDKENSLVWHPNRVTGLGEVSPVG
jgi:hypothetical protein